MRRITMLIYYFVELLLSHLSRKMKRDSLLKRALFIDYDKRDTSSLYLKKTISIILF